MLPAGHQEEEELSSSSVPPHPGDQQAGRNFCPKHVELVEIINKIIIVASS